MLPPGPPGRFLIGRLPVINRQWLAFLERCAREHGDVFHFRFLHLHLCYVIRPEYIESVLVTQHHNFIKAIDYRAMRRIFGEGLLTSEGETWRRQRRLAQPAFHRERIAAYSRLMVAATERMLGRWQDGQTLDVHEEMMRMTLEIVAKALFDADVEGSAQDVGAALNVAMTQFLSRVSTGFLIPEFLPTPANLRFKRAMRRLDQIVYGIIRERRSSGRDPGDLLSMLLEARDEDGRRMTDRQLRDEAMTLFLAGHETTANVLSWTWYLLAQHPEVEIKLADELAQVLGGRAPALEDIGRLRYCERVIKESLRLYPPAWGIGRQALGSFEVGGYRLPPKTNVFMCQWITHRDPRWFEQPERFDPDRWTEEFERRLPRFAYFPFGGGPRTCIGSSFAMMEAILLLAAVASRFMLALVPGHVVEIFPSITLRPKQGIRMRLTARVPAA
ncbi:MAG TPA: cytochrome P450 [Terriglobia bacterium]|nr:cytochrome P450 [Terriglobia bacterium]